MSLPEIVAASSIEEGPWWQSILRELGSDADLGKAVVPALLDRGCGS